MTALGTRSRRRSVSEESPHLRLLTAAFGIVLLGGALFRFWSLSSRPGWQYDEGVYTGVAANLLRHGTINEHITYGALWAPDLYQPPFYFIVLARWFALTGVSIYHARILGALCALVGLALLWRLLVRVHGPVVALYAMVPITFDGWLMYVQRISYMENMLLLLVVAAMLCYQRAIDTPSWWRFVAAGVVLGFAASFKYTGVYVIGAVLLCWLITQRVHLKHLALLGCALATFIGAILYEVVAFDTGGHNWWWQDTMVQVRRVLGIQRSGGTLTSPTAALHLLLAQYDVFAPSFLIALVTLVLALRRVWKCYRERDWRPVTDNALLWSWMASAIVIFGFLLAPLSAVLRADPGADVRLVLDRDKELATEGYEAEPSCLPWRAWPGSPLSAGESSATTTTCSPMCSSTRRRPSRRMG